MGTRFRENTSMWLALQCVCCAVWKYWQSCRWLCRRNHFPPICTLQRFIDALNCSLFTAGRSQLTSLSHSKQKKKQQQKNIHLVLNTSVSTHKVIGEKWLGVNISAERTAGGSISKKQFKEVPRYNQMPPLLVFQSPLQRLFEKALIFSLDNIPKTINQSLCL